MNKTQLLNQLTSDREERLLLARAMDQMTMARDRSVPTHTPFLSPHEQSLVRSLIAAAGNPRAVFWGGYPDAERRVCFFLPDWMEDGDADGGTLCAVRAGWKDGRNLTHRDFLGALMGLGITREKLGDLLVQSDSCDIIMLKEIQIFLLQNFESAGRSRLTVSAISPEDLNLPQVRVKTIRDTVSALRLDAVGAAGFSISRSKMTEMISGGRVSLNWQESSKSAAAIEEGDVISCRGLGKCRLAKVSGISRKGRILIEMERYL